MFCLDICVAIIFWHLLLPILSKKEIGRYSSTPPSSRVHPHLQIRQPPYGQNSNPQPSKHSNPNDSPLHVAYEPPTPLQLYRVIKRNHEAAGNNYIKFKNIPIQLNLNVLSPRNNCLYNSRWYSPPPNTSPRLFPLSLPKPSVLRHHISMRTCQK